MIEYLESEGNRIAVRDLTHCQKQSDRISLEEALTSPLVSYDSNVIQRTNFVILFEFFSDLFPNATLCLSLKSIHETSWKTYGISRHSRRVTVYCEEEGWWPTSSSVML